MQFTGGRSHAEHVLDVQLMSIFFDEELFHTEIINSTLDMYMYLSGATHHTLLLLFLIVTKLLSYKPNIASLSSPTDCESHITLNFFMDILTILK